MAVQNGMSQAELEALLAECTANQESINTCRFDMDMDIITDVVGGNDAGKWTVFTRSNFAVNLASNQGQMYSEMSIEMEGFGEEGIVQDVTYDAYMYPDWIYYRMEVPGMGEQWMKMPTTEELEVNFNTDMAHEHLGLLESAAELELLWYEEVDGEECYVLSAVPDMEKFMQLVAQQQGSTQDVDWEEIATFTDVYKKFEYYCYITKDSRMVKRIVYEMEIETTPEQAGASENDFDTMKITMSMDVKYYDYNEPFSMDLPDEAQDAMEVPNIFM
jgi:hypothetical protein